MQQSSVGVLAMFDGVGSCILGSGLWPHPSRINNRNGRFFSGITCSCSMPCGVTWVVYCILGWQSDQSGFSVFPWLIRTWPR